MHGPKLGASTGGYADLPTMWSLLPMLSRSLMNLTPPPPLQMGFMPERIALEEPVV
jgi:hypothetical protein